MGDLDEDCSELPGMSTGHYIVPSLNINIGLNIAIYSTDSIARSTFNVVHCGSSAHREPRSTPLITRIGLEVSLLALSCNLVRHPINALIIINAQNYERAVAVSQVCLTHDLFLSC